MKRYMPQAVFGLALIGLFAAVAAAQEAASGAEARFQRAFFLQTHDHDLAAAADEYEAVAADEQAEEALRKEARARLAAIREDLASTELARLMPPEVIAYAHLSEPGAHVERLLEMMGLTGPVDPEAAGVKPLELDEGLVLPADFTISPALVEELKKIRGAAVGMTGIDRQGMPSGLVVVHPGDCNLLRGVIETLVQMLEPGEPIEGFKTYRVPDMGWVMLSARLVLAADSREELAAAVERMRDPEAESLATQENYQRVAAGSAESLLFAYVDGPRAVERFGSQLQGRDMAMVRALLDLEHFESLVVKLTTTEQGISLTAQMNLMPGHKNMIYALIRTAPMTKRSLDRVPGGAAAVLTVGLNPPGPAAPTVTNSDGTPSISLMDVGREIFGNIDELSVFAMAPEGEGRQPFPEVGAVIAVKDPEKSEALWNQILSLAMLFGARHAQEPAEVDVEGTPGKTYHLDGMPPIVVVRTGKELVLGTPTAVAAAVRTGSEGKSIADDPAFAPLLSKLTPDSSKALLVDVGRAVPVVAALSGDSDDEDMRMIAALLADMKVSVVTDEAPNCLTIRAELTGLPKFRDVVQMLNGGGPRRTVAR